MLRYLIAFAALLAVSAPAMADTCSAAAEAATRSALASAEARGQRTATVQVACGGKTETFILHRTETARGTSISVRAVEPAKGGALLAAVSKRDFSASSAARIIRVGD